MFEEEFPELSTSLTLPSKSYKQNRNVSINHKRLSYSDKLQTGTNSSNNYNKTNVIHSSHGNCKDIPNKYNSQTSLNSNVWVKNSMTEKHTDSYTGKNNKEKNCTEGILNSQKNKIVNAESSEKISTKTQDKDTRKISYEAKSIDKATETKFSNETEKYENDSKSHRSYFSSQKTRTVQNFNHTGDGICNKHNYESKVHRQSSENCTNSYTLQDKQNRDKVKSKNTEGIEHNIASSSKKYVDNTKGQPIQKIGNSRIKTTSTQHAQELGNKTSRKRLSKVKRQTAFQTGKLLILTPDLHSRITQSLSEHVHNTSNNSSFDISNLDEYPSLNSQSVVTNEKFSKEILFQSTPKKELCISSIRSESDNLPGNIHSEVSTDTIETISGKSDLSETSNSTKENIENSKLKHTDGKKKTTKLKTSESKEKKPSKRSSIQLFEILSLTKSDARFRKKPDVGSKSSKIKSSSSKTSSTPRGLNVLDSSKPNIKRGKERETPKRKKLTPLKKVILLERLKKKELREQRKKECLLTFYSPAKDDSTTTQESDSFENSAKDSYPSEISNLANSCDITNSLCELTKSISIATETSDISTGNEEIQRTINEFKCNDNSFEDERNVVVQTLIHNKDFREYCNHLLSKELNENMILLIESLARFQDRQHQKDPAKARMKRRLIYGLKEVTKHLKLKKLKCIVIAPDLENIKATGGLNFTLAKIIQTAMEYHIPCIFAANRKLLGKACHKPVPVSCIGIFSYEGSESLFKKSAELHAECFKDYQYLKKVLINNLANEDIEEFTFAKENQTYTVVRHKLLKNILSKEIEDPQLLEKYNFDMFSWFRQNYLLRLIEVL